MGGKGGGNLPRVEICYKDSILELWTRMYREETQHHWFPIKTGHCNSGFPVLLSATVKPRLSGLIRTSVNSLDNRKNEYQWDTNINNMWTAKKHFNHEIYTLFMYLQIFAFCSDIHNTKMFKHTCLLQKLLVPLPNKDNMLFRQSLKRI